MKHIFLALLAVILVIGLTACSAEERQAQDEKTDGENNMAYSSWDDVPMNTYRKETITVDYNGQTIWGVVYIPETDDEK